jgi:hypothetical protein
MPSTSSSNSFVELDVFRGLAAWLMVLNHAGFAWLSADGATSGWAGGVVFLGGFAPVLFFFATGAGMGLSAGRLKRPGGWQDLLWKAGLLVVADQLLFLRQGQAVGLDFFGFIALSMVVVSLVDAHQHPVRLAFVLAGVLLLVRYGLVPMLKSSIPDVAWIHFVLGSNVVPNVSYPLAPWMAFPLVAYGLARLGWFPRWPSVAFAGVNKRTLGIVLGGTLLLAVSLVAYLRGGVFYRWGSMNALFFMLAVGVIAWFVLTSETLAKLSPCVADAVALRGVAAFLVVPVHYAVIKGANVLSPAPWSNSVFALAAVAAVVLSLAVSRWLAQGIARWPPASRMPWLVTLVASVALTAWLGSSSPMQAFVAATVGQVLAAALLNVRGRRRQSPAVVAR